MIINELRFILENNRNLIAEYIFIYHIIVPQTNKQLEIMKNQLLQLQSQIDSLRSKLQSKSRLNKFDEEFEKLSKKLSHLDGLFSRLCNKHEFQLSKFGRL